MTKSEQKFEVSLGQMMHAYEFGDSVVWLCKLGGPWIDEDPSCRTSTVASSEPEARSAAIAHLAEVHGIHLAGDGAADEELTKAIAWLHEVIDDEPEGAYEGAYDVYEEAHARTLFKALGREVAER